MEPNGTRQTLFGAAGWNAIRLSGEDLGELQELLDESVDYYRLITGAPPGPAEANFLFHATPEGTRPQDKYVVGCVDPEGNLFGVIDLVPDYPQPATWTLGLLLLAPDRRRKGLGSAIYSTFEQWAAEQRAQQVELAIAEQNTAAYDFWRHIGFEEIERLPPRIVGNKMTVIIRMRRELE
ncbi:MAG: GNAT family N-acetyltransferase [Bradymonadales bacterium]|nr:GNAT family N-acetyltransferase [Bradymonadales bacterium]